MGRFLRRALCLGASLGLTILAASCIATSATADDPALDALLKRFIEEFVSIAPGKEPFPEKQTLGSSNGPENEQPQYDVQPAPFSIAKYEVPQNLYEAVMGHNPSRWKGPRNSVEMMTWLDAVAFCQKTTQLLRERRLIAANEEIRLPSEGEWEYACRAGSTTDYSFGAAIRRAADPEGSNSILDEYAWYTGNAAGNDPPVGALKPNPWGLYDMHGYLWEFTADGWTEDHQGAPRNGAVRPPQPTDQPIVLKSGSWKDPAAALRSASRKKFGQRSKDDAVGLRCVRAAVAAPVR
jgi:formylglycine-generating enzyme required for sulfatase activity